MTTIAFLGLGHMGGPMAANLVAAGHTVRGFDPVVGLRDAAEEKGVDIELSGDAWVHGNRLMVQRAISNLLSNAIRHAPAGSQVDIDIKGGAEGVALCVGNPGPGIEPQHLPHLFERFYRADGGRSRQEGGTGLGLAIVRSIMSLHNGSVAVDSAAEGPTRFHLRFPNAAA